MVDPDDEILGPIEYAVVEFAPARRDQGRESAMELAALVDTELIRILDLVVLLRRDDATFDVVEYEQLADRSGFPMLDGRLAEVLSEDDVERFGATLAPGASGMVIVFEDTWAAPLGAALRAGGERIVANGHIATADLVAALAADEGVAP